MSSEHNFPSLPSSGGWVDKIQNPGFLAFRFLSITGWPRSKVDASRRGIFGEEDGKVNIKCPHSLPQFLRQRLSPKLEPH